MLETQLVSINTMGRKVMCVTFSLPVKGTKPIPNTIRNLLSSTQQYFFLCFPE